MHKSVLYKEAIEGLNINPSGRYIDATLGYGGHSGGILGLLNEKGFLFAFDQDEDAINYSKTYLGKISDNFEIDNIDIFLAKFITNCSNNIVNPVLLFAQGTSIKRTLWSLHFVLGTLQVLKVLKKLGYYLVLLKILLIIKLYLYQVK